MLALRQLERDVRMRNGRLVATVGSGDRIAADCGRARRERLVAGWRKGGKGGKVGTIRENGEPRERLGMAACLLSKAVDFSRLRSGGVIVRTE
jgi:hypothetical protein